MFPPRFARIFILFSWIVLTLLKLLMYSKYNKLIFDKKAVLKDWYWKDVFCRDVSQIGYSLHFAMWHCMTVSVTLLDADIIHSVSKLQWLCLVWEHYTIFFFFFLVSTFTVLILSLKHTGNSIIFFTLLIAFSELD